MQFPEKTLLDLDWPKLLEHLVNRCSGEEAADICRNLPFLEETVVQDRLVLVGELLDCIVSGDPPPSLPANPIDEWLGHIRGQGIVSGEGLRHIAANLNLFVAIARYLENRRDTCPKNASQVVPDNGLISPIGLARLSAEIESSFEPDGKIADGASPELGRLRRRLISVRQHLVSQIEKIATHESDLLQENTIRLRNDRFVLPVRADAHRRLPGIVHGASSSGATVFVEPASVVGIGNDLMLAREEVAREEARILTDLCESVRCQLQEVSLANSLLIKVEVLIASARLSNDLSASVPVTAQTGKIELRQARHPLLVLDGIKVVPFDINLPNSHTIVISGPNAGGKTVALKTLGICCLMVAAGLPIPADPDSKLRTPHNILTDIGDDQSLEKNLSTFSAHMTNLTSVLTTAGPGSVVLLDELAAGTDPGEGAALAQSICEKLNSIGASTLATTHFDALKLWAQTGKGSSNSAVGFDMEKMLPTFQLRQGTPGSSSALAVARRFGAPTDVISRAKEIMPQETRSLADAVEALDKERGRLFLERQALVDARRISEEAKNKAQQELRQLRARQNNFLDSESEALWSSIRHAREKISAAETSIRRNRLNEKAATKARQTVNAVAEELGHGGNLNTKSSQDLPGIPATAEHIHQGAKVYVTTFNKHGVVDSALKGGRAFVNIGSIRTRIPLKDLHICIANKKDKSSSLARPNRSSAEAIVEQTDIIRTEENTVDVRGMTVDEATNATEKFLDRALLNNNGSIFIIHGHGTGALRNALREFLQDSSYVERSRPGKREDGGDGITVAWLR
jgi:DNA mismatch repair protein MutS2